MPETDGLPQEIQSVFALEELLSRPSREVVEAMRRLNGDLLVLGVGGKMGPTLARLARRACDDAGVHKRVIGVSRFSDGLVRRRLEEAGIETIACDLLDRAALRSLPEAPNIVYMAGTKFGSAAAPALTWALNAYLPGEVVQRFPQSRMVLFSSGNVYPMVPVSSGGCTEQTPPAPMGEYAQSVLGRERVFSYWAERLGVPGIILRLNYAVEPRYGVLLDVARRVWGGEPIPLEMGHVNVLWQGDANAWALRALELASVPPRVLNITGPEIIAIRALAERLGRLLGREPPFTGCESEVALLNNAGSAHALFGLPRVPLGRIVEWVADWVRNDRPTLGKPTHYGVRDGRF